MRPNPESERAGSRKLGWVHAYAGDAEACRLSYGEDLDNRIVRTTQFCTGEDFRCQGCATGLVVELRAAYPGFRVLTSGMAPTSDGASLLASLERKGLIEIVAREETETEEA